MLWEVGILYYVIEYGTFIEYLLYTVNYTKQLKVVMFILPVFQQGRFH